MKSNMNNEPSLNKIDDYNGKESKSKRNTIRLIIIGLIVLGAIYSFFKYDNNQVNDYIGTPENPGISTTKK
ncbi:hypothetical protein Arnit_1242 [Arcobacter nitrofigilis DSM 7299]|uniref:Uncharacterized protein n=1 Tax=Arcobacter nitrofigilis (strain ATCC 33309 / DSM 7299 / CCUG 15893 / LMG 7604 / NCTC 12251 / CI) TaxID=572480 RepID=D5V4J5_ARCNC|nr:hypothetical protein [Arcobacter nitrofigilis]ADG92900.1 hypothetical protein Arnit_1242 [Arcobacter nitrofigilis DSM 7299]